MIKKYKQIALAATIFWMAAAPINSSNTDIRSNIRRLTYSGNNVAQYPCLSDDGRLMLYIVEIKNNEETRKAVKVINVENGKEKELFCDGKRKALAPFEDISLIVGSKPPVLSGNGRVAVFSLSLGEPADILDHYLAVVNTDGTDFQIINFPFDSLKGKDLESLDFTSSDWERVSNYTISSNGVHIACVVKGHLGPRRYGNPSGIIFFDNINKKQKTVLAPDFNGSEWIWPSLPRQPLSGGGWAFGMSGNGQWLLFGAQSSEDKNDYDLYVTNRDGEKITRITDFHDRWFSLADISHDGKKIVFFYNGIKKQGMGTYTVNIDGSGLKYLESRIAPRIELFDMSGNGRYVLFKHIYKGMILDLNTGLERVAFDAETPGYITGLMPMDFPRIPAFWRPKIMSFRGDKALLVGPPRGKETPEIYMLTIDVR